MFYVILRPFLRRRASTIYKLAFASHTSVGIVVQAALALHVARIFAVAGFDLYKMQWSLNDKRAIIALWTMGIAEILRAVVAVSGVPFVRCGTGGTDELAFSATYSARRRVHSRGSRSRAGTMRTRYRQWTSWRLPDPSP
jgi:hypothetical protein